MFSILTNITNKLPLHAAKSNNPSLSKSQIKEYDKMRQEFERRDDDNVRKRVGFFT